MGTLLAICTSPQRGTVKTQVPSARLTPEFELATSDLIVQFAERSLGIGCVVEAFARRAIADGTVFRIPTEPDIPPRQLCVARSRRPASKAAAALLELILR